MKTILTVLLTLVVGIGIYGGLWYSYSYDEVSLRNSVVAQQQQVENRFDTCWKIIQQTTQVTDAARQSFEKVYVDIMQARGLDKGGTFMKWINENNPTFDIGKNFDRLTVIIEAQRMQFQEEQKRLIDKNKEYSTLIQSPLGHYFLAGKEPIKIVVISSDVAKNAMVTGIDNNVELKLGKD